MDTNEFHDCLDVDAYFRSCPSHQVLASISDKWSMLTLTALYGTGPTRHGEIKRRLEGISPKMLSQTLRRFERDGLVVRTQYPTIPPKVTYELTPLGLELGDLCRSIKQWSEQHYPAIHAARENFDRSVPATG
jgi:DNA-binding HxlR family transcriptional regulator